MEHSNESASIPMDKLARVYRKIRARIQELTTAYETEFETLEAQRIAVKTALKDQMLALGGKSVNTEEGVVILSTKTRYSTQDWDSFKRFMIENDAIDLLEKRIAQTNMATFLKENPGVVPPGLNSHTEYSISVTKPRTRK
jgi:hypothetical protein